MSDEQKTAIAHHRRDAWAKFQRIGLPTPTCEAYRRLPVTRLLAKSFSDEELTLATVSSWRDVEPFLIEGMKRNRIVFINGVFSEELTACDPSLYVASLQQAWNAYPKEIEKRFTSHEGNDPFALLNASAWQDGAFVRVGADAACKEPLAVYHLHDARQKKVAAHTRLVVIMEPGSRLEMVEKTNSAGNHPVFSTLTEEIDVGEKAELIYCKIQNDEGALHKITNTYIRQNDKSCINLHTLALNGQLIRNNLNVKINGEHCESNLYGLYMARASHYVDNHTSVDHKKPNSVSNELYKGIIGHRGQGIFNGKIYVRAHAQKTNAFQSNRNILCADSATVHAKPQLEIWADDVKCSHGCTSGQLDDEALFYLQSRGIAKPAARSILLHAFAREVTDAIEDKNLGARMDHIVHSQLQKYFEL